MKKRLIFILAGVVISVILFFIITYSLKEPPLSEIHEARKKLTEAQGIQASVYANEKYNAANALYESTMKLWKNENERFILFRNYSQVRNSAEQAGKLAEEAITKTIKNISNAKDLLGIRIISVENKVNDFDLKYGNLPYNVSDQKKYMNSKLLLKEAIYAYNKSNYPVCKSKLDSADNLITLMHESSWQFLEEYFQKYDQWQQWLKASLANSKKNKTFCIIIDKYARECALYKNGTLLQKFEIELGINWIGDKNYQGDKSTPEGFYKVVSKKSNGATRYYKAFLLDYPNDEDKQRFVLNKNQGLVKQDAKIGNLIEIHGNGGKGIDWTDGCIALKDEDMDKLFSACKEGTQVIIVGSLKPLEELL